MEKCIGLLTFILSFSCITLAEPGDDLNKSLRKQARLGVAAIIGACLTYEAYTRYVQSPEDTGQHEQNSVPEEEVPAKPKTLTDRVEFFSKGMGYSLATAGSILATYFSILFSLTHINGLDLEQEAYKQAARNGYSTTDLIFKKRLEIQRQWKRAYMGASAITGSLALGIPYLAYYRYRLPHAAVENFKKAFQR